MGMPLGQLVKKQFTAQKLIFNVLFWGLHWGIFAFGWYVCWLVSALVHPSCLSGKA